MAWQPPLVPFIQHVADPPELPARGPGDPGPARVLRATPAGGSADGALALVAELSDGSTAHLLVEAAGADIIRVRLAPDPATRPRAAAVVSLVAPAGPGAGAVTLRPNGAVVDAGNLRAEVGFAPWALRFTRPDGRVLLAANTDETDISNRLRVLPLGRSPGAGGEAPAAYHETFTLRPDEHLYGLGEKFTELDKRGQRIVSWNYDAFSSESERSYKNIPFYLSTRGYGVLVHSGAATEFDLGHSTHSCAQITVPDDLIEYFVIGGPAPADVLRRYHELTGRPVVPPKWAVGTWMSTGYFPSGQDDVLRLARQVRDRGLPCDVLHLDAYWQPRLEWSGMDWNPESFPDPPGLLAELRELGFRVCLWINPYVSVHSPRFEEAAGKGFFLRHADGSVYVADSWHGAKPPCGIVDLTNPEAVHWYQDLLRPLLRAGVTVFKTDFGEGVPVDAHTASGLTGETIHNVYALLFNDAVADVTEEIAGHRVVWARSSFTGGQRHGAQWAGDNNSTFTGMASTLRGGLSYALSGVPYWSHDVGGFTGEPSPDLMVRSSQFGAFSPMLRFHGTSSRFAWDFDEHTERLVIAAVRLRYRLMPYVYSAVVAAAGGTGLPVIRPLVVDAPAEPGSWSADQEYLLGPDLLVAPVTNPEGERYVYLPPGRWADFWTGETHDGGRHRYVSAPLDRIPLFVRHGALIAEAAPADTVGWAPFAPITLACWGTAEADTVVHDEGSTTRIRVTVSDDGTCVVTSDGPTRIGRVVFPPAGDAAPPRAVTVNGVPATWEAGAARPTAVTPA